MSLRISCAPLSAACLLLLFGGTASADFLATANDLNGETELGLRRYDRQTGVRLTAGELAPLSLANVTPRAPADIVASPDGLLAYSVDAVTGTVLMVDTATGQPASSPNVGLPSGVFAQRASAVFGLQFTALTFGPGPDGLLYVADSSDVTGTFNPELAQAGIRVYDPATGNQVDTLLDASGFPLGTLSGLAFLPDGDLLVSDLDAATIYRIDPSDDLEAGEQPEIFSIGAAFGPAGIAVSPQGDVFVADLFGNRVVKLDGNGGNAQNLIVYPQPATNVSVFPSDLAFDDNGDLIVAVLGPDDYNPATDSGSGQLLRHDATTGALLETIASGLAPTSSFALVPDLLPADFNGDGLVDAADYTVWRDTLNDTVTPGSGADADGDGVVTIDDYEVWRETFGDSGLLPPPIESALTAAPEPGAGLLLLVGLAAWGFRRR